MLAGTQYLNRHNTIGKYIHWCILKEANSGICTDCFKHIPTESTECKDITVMWDMTIYTDTCILANRPDIFVHDWTNQKVTITDIIVPNNKNLIKKLQKNVIYRDLEPYIYIGTPRKYVEIKTNPTLGLSVLL